MNKIIIIKNALKEVFEKYKDKGAESLYLWGSITTPDFNIATSDIDCVVIVNEAISLDLERQMTNELEALFPEISRFGLRFLYKEELKSGKGTTSYLGKSISPRILVADFPYWEFIAGTKYDVTDFTREMPPFPELMFWYWEQLEKKGYEKAEDVPQGEEKRFSKILWRIIYTMQIERGLKSPFCYSQVQANANEREAVFLGVLIAIKSAKYNREVFLKHAEVLNNLIAITKDIAQGYGGNL